MLQVRSDLFFVTEVCIACRIDSQFAQASKASSPNEIHVSLDDNIIEQGISF